MKSLNLKLVILFLSIVTLVSCSKQKDDVSADNSIAGHWEGKYGGGQEEPDSRMALTIHANGTLLVTQGEDQVEPNGTGTWTLNDGTFNVVYKYNDEGLYYNISAKLNDAGNKIMGDWGYGETVADKGKIYFEKQ